LVFETNVAKVNVEPKISKKKVYTAVLLVKKPAFKKVLVACCLQPVLDNAMLLLPHKNLSAQIFLLPKKNNC
jgi:hypothetical protein